MKNWLSKLKKYLKEKNRFIIQNPISFQQKFSLTLTKRNTILVLVGFTLIFGGIMFSIISFTSLKNFIPGYPSKGSELYKIDKENQLKLNELTSENRSRDLWIKNLQSILSNSDTISLQTLNESLQIDSNFDYKSIVFERTKQDSALRKKVAAFEKNGKFSLAKTILKEALFFEMPLEESPAEVELEGVLNLAFSCKKKKTITCVMDGRIVSQQNNSVVLQHAHDLVTVFSGISTSQNGVGDFVERGMKLGSTSDTTLFLQVWYKGESLPLSVINH
jgi:hypothetical protein